ncbi:hypothetical protein HD554DRAFT_271221 [Boletus coccyginus]|nr:hypothetical protein HD554DRAFT_271221 [Boletus coccyginus]
MQSVSSTHFAIDPRGSYNQLGAASDLERAIVLYREALDIRPQGHPARSSSLNSLAVGLSIRYQQLGTTEDLDEAIVLGREALALRPRGHRDRLVSLNNLAVDLSSRNKYLKTIEDLDEAIVLEREVLDLCPHGHTDWSMSLNNLAVSLSTRYKQLGREEDLNEAITMLEMVGDDASNAGKQDEAVAAYSAALSLGPTVPNAVLIKWANAILKRGSALEVLSAATKSSAIYRLPCYLRHSRRGWSPHKCGRVFSTNAE